MKTIFSYIAVNYAEWQYFITLSDADKLQYLFEIYEVEHRKGSGGIDLSKFFEAVKDTIINNDLQTETTSIEEFGEGTERVDVMIDDDNIMIESNSLKAVRLVHLKFAEGGYLLQRDKELEKMFRKDKVTRYLRVYRIVDQISGICIN
jgi:hypothetical protein